MVFANPFKGSTHQLTVTEQEIILAWAYNPDFGKKGYAAVIRLLPEDGRLESDGRTVRLTGGTRLTLMHRIVKFEHDFTFASAEGVWKELRALPADFEGMLADNERIIGEKMDRSRIHLGRPEDNVLSGEELLRRTHSREELDLPDLRNRRPAAHDGPA